MAEHSEARKMINKNCLQCNKDFFWRNCPTDISSGRGKFCSRKCSIDSQRTFPKEFQCQNCHINFPNKFGKFKKFCSKKCADNFRIGKPSTRKNYIPTLETRKRQSIARMGKEPWNKGRPWPEMRGKNNPRWTGGSSPIRLIDMGRSEYINWKISVFKRDKYTCVKCGCKNNKELQADHILMWKTHPWERFNIDNGQTLCKKCHRKKTGKDLSIHFRMNHILKEMVRDEIIEEREELYDGIKIYSYKLKNDPKAISNGIC